VPWVARSSDERHTTATHPGDQQAASGKFDAQRATQGQPTASRAAAGGPAKTSARTSPTDTGRTRPGSAPQRAAKPGHTGGPRQRERRQHGGKAAQRDDIGAAGGALAAVQLSQPVALAVRIVHAVGEAAHERGLLLAPAAALDGLEQDVHLGSHPRTVRATPLHELAHARLADAQTLGGLRAREALQITETGSLLLARVESLTQSLESVAQLETVIERARQVRLDASLQFVSGALQALLFATALAVLVDGATKAHNREPSDGVLRLLTFHELRVQPLPGLRITGFKIGKVEDDPARTEIGAHAGQHALTRTLKVAAQQALGSIASQHRRAHGPKAYDELGEFCDLVESHTAHVFPA
jgi:hypothetical protein